MGIAALFSWAAWIYVLIGINPEEAGALSFFLFYLTLFLALVGTLSVLGVIFRARKAEQALLFREVRIAFRHAVILSSATILALFLASQDLLTWWNFIAIFVGIGVVEYLFLILQENRRG